MERGYYTSPDMDEALHGLVSQDNRDIDGIVFLHGFCGVFALALHDTFNYELALILFVF